MDNISRLKEIISKAKNVVITSHLNPDGDAVGSSLAVNEWLRNKGINSTVILPNEPPASLRFVGGYEDIKFYATDEVACREIIDNADTLFSMDYNDIATRIGDMGSYILQKEELVKVLIDHHLAPPVEKFNLSLADPTASSASFLAARIIKDCGDFGELTLQMANNIYLGMMTDTGNFSYGNLTSEVYRIVADLVDKGVSTVDMSIQVMQQQSENRLRLMGYAISKKMVILKKYKCAYIWLTAEELERFSYVEGDVEGLVNMPLSMAGVVSSALFIEKKELIKISLRSQGDEGFDMNNFARTYFIGGGHRNAAGGKSYKPMRSVIRDFKAGLKLENEKLRK